MFLGFCKDDTWTARKCKAVYKYLDGEGYNWYALSHDQTNGKPYLGKRVPQVDQYDTQVDKYDFPPPRTAEQIAADKGKEVEYLTDYDSDSTNLKQAKETHSTDEELNKKTSIDTSIIRNSPIGTRPELSPSILTVMMTATTTQPTITVQAAPAATTTSTSTTTAGSTTTPTQRITTA